ncbi:hypothetical protein NMQ14_18450 [Methyloversatilis sp. XJ19-13]|nr:hypothetical protein [Methyloversatilis sp. XJ19-13]
MTESAVPPNDGRVPRLLLDTNVMMSGHVKRMLGHLEIAGATGSNGTKAP